MKKKPLNRFFSAGVVCISLGLMAWTNFIGEITSGDLDLLNFETILFPIGIALIKPSAVWSWIARLQLFALSLYSGTIVFGFLLMSEETKFLVYEVSRSGGAFSGTGIVLFLHVLFFCAILWIYFSIFAGRSAQDPLSSIHVN